MDTANRAGQKRPVIGVTCGEIYNKDEAWTAAAYGQTRTYVDSIIAGGGLPLLLPLSDDYELLEQLGAMLDGLCLAGGNDLNPKLYGQTPLPTTNDYSDLRDATELLVLKQMLTAKKPILAICRGMQLLNVHFGGTLHQDLTAIAHELDHDASNKLKSLVDLSHTLRIDKDSKLASIIGPEDIGANAHHHQAADTLGDGIRAVAWTADGIIEAIELTDYPYAIGIEAHPESLLEVEPRWTRLFTSFVTACKP
jgi:putative glutamine amidotransferase